MHGKYLAGNGRVIRTNYYQLRANIDSLRLDVDSGGSDVEDLRLNVDCLHIHAPSFRHKFCGSLAKHLPLALKPCNFYCLGRQAVIFGVVRPRRCLQPVNDFRREQRLSQGSSPVERCQHPGE